ncbi:MAG TPA: UDP-N-acetylmuramate dehydrogenase [Acidobacteriota bacterium]|nr:UDP-N-acetylmuramate dehydrogenase [Acidobacteriota bacterium]
MKIKKDQKLKDYTTIGIGGPVPIVYLPETESELVDLLKNLSTEKKSYRILGNGSNILADDRGLKDAIVCTKNLQRIFGVEDNKVHVDAGYPVAQLAYQTAAKSLSGMEFAIGIPGSIGGVVRMNAGAHKRTISEVVDSVRMVMPDCRLVTARNQDLHFTYRSSAIPRDAIIIEVTLQLHAGDSKEIHEKIRRFNDERTSTQPLREKSAGCIFKNPVESSAGKLIEDSGLKGHQVGGARVSEMHANFIVNRGDASFQDVLKLIDHIKDVVREKKGVSIQEEVVIWRRD